MPTWKFSRLGSSLLTLLISSVSPLAQATAQVVGTVGSVNKDARGTPPGRGSANLEIGQNVVQRERIETDTNGTAHIMFNDRSALNIGRNSNMVIDNFVYDPAGGAGRQIVTLTQGAARFVGGQISHRSETTIKTPVASIGVRGGNVTILQDGHSAVVMVHNGVATVANEFGSQTVRTGYQVTVRAGAAPEEPVRISLERLREATRRLASVGRQTGGAIDLPTDSQAGRRAIGSPRAPVVTPNIDAPSFGDTIVRGRAATGNKTRVINPTGVYLP